MQNKVTVRYNAWPLVGAGFTTWLVFFILKMTNVLPESFSWFWVWFPLWIPFAFSGVVLIVFFILYMIFNRD